MFNIYLPVAQMSINIFYLVIMGLSAGFLSGLYGIGGGIVAVPIMIFCGIPANIAIVTSFLQIVCLSGVNVMKNLTSENMRYMIAVKIGFFSIIGAKVGAEIFMLLQNTNYFLVVVNMLYILLMFIIGMITMIDGLKYLYIAGFNGKNEILRHNDTKFTTKVIKFGKVVNLYKNGNMFMLNVKAKFRNMLLIAISGMTIGILSGIMGIGGGFLSLAIIMYIFHENIRTSAVTSSLIGIITTLPNAIYHIHENSGVDPILGIAVGFIGIIGIKFGNRVNLIVNENCLKFLFGILLICISFKISADLFVLKQFPYVISIIKV